MRRFMQPLALLLAVVCVARAQAPADGMTVTTHSRIDSGGTTTPVEMSLRRQTMGNRSRVETTQSPGQPGMEGMYIIYRGDDSTVMGVIPSQRTATIMVASMARSFAPSFTENLTRHTVEDLGPGEPILGHATRHYRVTRTGAFEVAMMGEKCSAPLNETAEHWIAADVDLGLSDTAGSVFMSSAPTVSMKRTGVPATMPKGASLRTISKSVRKGPDGNSLTVTSTSEVIELVKGPLDSALFAAPPDYRVMDLRQLMGDMPPGALEAASGQQAKTLVANMCKVIGGS